MPRVVLIRLLLVALPFVVWFVWRWVAKRTGREMGSTPWAWLAAAGALLVGLSLIGSAVFHVDNRHEAYVPGQVTADGKVTQGRFEPSPDAPKGPPK